MADIIQMLVAALNKKNPTPEDVGTIRTIINALETQNPGAHPLPLPASLGANPAQEAANSAYWIRTHPRLTEAFKQAIPEGKSYGGKAAASVAKGGTAVPKAAAATPATPAEAAAVENAVASGRTPIVNEASRAYNAQLKAELQRQLGEEQVLQEFAKEKFTPQFIPGARTGALRTLIPQQPSAATWTTAIEDLPHVPGLGPIGSTVGPGTPLNFGGENIMAGNLARRLAQQATGQVESAAASTPGAIASTAEELPFIASSARGPQTLQQYLGTGFQPTSLEVPELNVLAHTPQSLEAAIASQAVPEAEAAAKAGLTSRLLNPSTMTGKTLASLGYGLAGELGAGVIKNMGTNPQGETSDTARVLAAAARGAGFGAGVGTFLPGGPLTTGLGALVGGAGAGAWEALFGHPSIPFDTKRQTALTAALNAIPGSLDPTTRSNLQQQISLQYQFAQTPDDLKQITATIPTVLTSALSQAQADAQRTARLTAVQSSLAPLLSRIYDTSQQATNQAYITGMSASKALTDPQLAALAAERATNNRAFANQQTQANLSSLATYPAAQSLDLFNNLNDQVNSSLLGQMAARIAAGYLPSKSSAQQSLTAFAG